MTVKGSAMSLKIFKMKDKKLYINASVKKKKKKTKKFFITITIFPLKYYYLFIIFSNIFNIFKILLLISQSWNFRIYDTWMDRSFKWYHQRSDFHSTDFNMFDRFGPVGIPFLSSSNDCASNKNETLLSGSILCNIWK